MSFDPDAPVVLPPAREVGPAGATLLTCRLVQLHGDDTGEIVRVLDMGHVVHEVPPGDWFVELPELDTDDEVVLMVELWEEGAVRRWLLDEREVSREIADALAEDKLDELLEGGVWRP